MGIFDEMAARPHYIDWVDKYESPLERDFAYQLVKYLQPGCAFEPQKELATPWGTYRADFGITIDTQTVIFEVDGKEFHDTWVDEWRDSAILAAGHADAVYRLRGQDVHWCMDECLYVLSRMVPEVFSPVGRLNLETLGWPRIISLDVEFGSFSVTASTDGAEPHLCGIEVRSPRLRWFPQRADYLRANAGRPLERLRDEWQSSWSSGLDLE